MHFNEALFWTALTAFGTGLYFIMEASRKWIAWGVMILGAGGMVYSVYRNYHTDALGLPIWFYLLAVTWILLGSDVYDRKWGRKSKSAKSSAEWRQGFSRPRFEIIDDHRFENEEIVVDNKSFRRCSFKNVKLLFHGQAPFEFVEGTTIDPGSVFLNTDDPAVMAFNFMQIQFASLPGAKIQPGALDSRGKDIPLPPLTVGPIEKAKESSRLTHFVFTNVISLSVDEKTVSRGKTLKIRYEVESSEGVSDDIWLGASLWDKSGKSFWNIRQDKPISLLKGIHEYDRDLTISANVSLGNHTLRANVWRGVLGDSTNSMIIAKGSPVEIVVVA